MQGKFIKGGIVLKKILANKNAHGGDRPRADVKYIVIHNTGVNNDTAISCGNYFKKWNTRKAGAHFFIDRQGEIVKSVNLKTIAWSVGGNKYTDCNRTGGGTLHGIVKNSNSVSIELCDIMKSYPSKKQIQAVKECIAYIRKYCKNAKTVVRHFDVTGKYCPQQFMDNKEWERFKADIGEL